MAGDDYAPVVSGSLKLKGSKPSGIGKKKKKKSKPNASADVTDEKKLAIQKALEEDDDEITKDLTRTANDDVKNALEAARKDKGSELSSEEIREVEERQLGSSKTETERRMEETRRKRLIQRLEKEGIKTHKERVEELNTYLSRLSEHHDMPRIGPG